MEKSHTSVNGGEHWMALEGGADGPPGGGSYTSRFVGDRRLGSRAAGE